ncbi:MAG: translation initiation factor IF-2 [Saprospiraceae bacterium]
MAKRLIKIAKELNVGTTTIVDHLNKSGYEIDNKPTAKVTDEMYEELIKEFQKSIAIKEQADQLVIGTRTGSGKKDESTPEPQVEAPTFVPPTPEVKVEPVEEEVIEQPVAEEEVVEEEMVEEIVEETPVVVEETPVVQEEVKKEEVVEEVVEDAEAPKIQLKIKGKIDLDANKKKAKEEVEETAPVVKPTKPETPVVEAKKEEEEEEEEEKVVEEKVVAKDKAPKIIPVEEKAPSEKVTAKEEKEPAKEDGMMRAKTPQLKGLKILGKIDTDKLKKKKKVKKTTTTGKTSEGASDSPEKKKRRKRKKVTTVESGSNNRSNSGDNRSNDSRSNSGGRSGGNNRSNNRGRTSPGRRRDEVKEVSKKEIDEKIKQTMARLSGGGKNKRQKIRRDNRDRHREKQEKMDQKSEVTNLQLTEFISVSELASLMDVPVTDVIMTCMNLGAIVSINQRLDAEIIEIVANEFGHVVEFISAEEQSEDDEEIVDDPEDLVDRSPIVTVMGHVDHGKTSLLDYIREAKVADGEAGGITQHIGAYEVRVGPDNKKITFLDTPGHEAFTAMRARGAKVTDIAVIIISADDNIMPQTKEAISHAQAAGVPIIFAINKIDKDGAQPERIKQELATMNFLVEDWGGKYQSQDISAKKGTNIDLLLEKILLEAEILELKANPDRAAIGTLIEASLDKGRGYVSKILVQTGTLRIGNSVVAGEHSGKVKAMFNEFGKKIKTAGPSTPVLILGLSGAPQAGEKFKVLDTEQEARQIASKRAQIVREQTTRANKRISLDEIGRRLALGTFKELNLIIKGDVDGSVEALSDSLIKQSIETVQVNVIHKAVGQIIESDVLLASASDAIIIGFQVRPSLGARKLAEREGVEIKSYSIIYEAIEEIKMAIEGMLEPTKEEKIVSQIEVRETYKISRIGTIAGCYVLEGKFSRNTHLRLIRDGIVIYPTKEGVKGEVASLKRFKEDVKEVKSGFECGITIKNYNDIKVGDIIEGYEIVEVKQKLS